MKKWALGQSQLIRSNLNEAQLAGELKAVFGCLWEKETRTWEIARRLGMGENAVVLARRRLAARLKRLRVEGLD